MVQIQKLEAKIQTLNLDLNKVLEGKKSLKTILKSSREKDKFSENLSKTMSSLECQLKEY